MLDTLRQDVRFALRTLRRNGGFALVMVLTLALGTGANTAIFSVAESVLLKPLPYPHDDQLVELWTTGGKAALSPAGRAPLSYRDVEDASGLHEDLSGVAAFTDTRYDLTGQGEPLELQAALASPSLFELLGVRPALGRAFAPSELRSRVVVLSHGLWLQLFGGDAGAVGSVLTLDGNGYTVVGVMPAGFAFPDEGTQLWAPLGQAFVAQPEMETNPDFHGLDAVARLRDGIDVQRLESDLAVVAARRNTAPQGLEPQGFGVVRLRDEAAGDARTPLLVLLAVVGFVLVIACVNAANLLLARAGARQREIAVRRALGAGAGRLVRQLLTESVVLALAGGVVGLILADAGVSAILRAWPAVLPRTHAIGLDAATLAYALLVSVVTGIAFGLAPALRSRAAAMDASLHGGAAATAGPGRYRLQRGLVVAEIALALVVLTGAGLLVRSFVRLRSVDPGYDTRDVLAARISLAPARYESEARQREFYRSVIEELRRQPGVEEASVTRTLPMSGEVASFRMTTGDIRPDDPEPFIDVDHGVVGPGFFRALQIPLLAGRTFTDGDREGAQPVAVVNAALARRLWPGENPIGRTLPLREGETVIVGEVGNVHYASLTDPVKLDVYQPFSQVRPRRPTPVWIVARAAHDPLHLASAVRTAVAAVDPLQPVAAFATLGGLVSRSTAARSFNMTLVGVFALLALGLAVVGIYGVTAYTVQQRTREIGVRVALGAARRHVLRLVLVETGVTAGIGILIGLAGALGFTRLLGSLLYDVSVTDGATFVVTTAILGAAALMAALVPALRAARIDPVQALRSE